MQLYEYFRSSAAYRVRIALNIKGISYDSHPIHLVNNGGEQNSLAYQSINPQCLVPSLIDDGKVLTQSMAILEYLEEVHPQPALLPPTPAARARVRAIAQIIASDVHPLNNLRVLKYLQGELGISDEQKTAWYAHWIRLGFSSIETLLDEQRTMGLCCFGDEPTLADVCLIPQVYNAKRFDVALDDYPLIGQINDYCLSLPTFAGAVPERVQPD